MLTYGPAMRTVRALLDNRLPVLLANIQPERSVTAAWDMADLTYNQGIHGAQDQANALVRTGVPFSVLTGDWQSPEFAAAFEAWARAAQAVTALRVDPDRPARLPDERHGRHPLRPAGAAARDRAAWSSTRASATSSRACRTSPTPQIEEVIGRHAELFEVDPDLPREAHAYAARMEVALRGLLEENGYRGLLVPLRVGRRATGASSSCRCSPPRT